MVTARWKRTVTCLRSPSTVALAWRIFSARSGTRAGDGVVVRPPIVRVVPQPPQYFSLAAIGTLQEGQPTANSVPHCVQKRRSDRLSY
jgi:hypothetical protein